MRTKEDKIEFGRQIGNPLEKFMQQVRALVVDDSAIFRMLVHNALSSIPSVTVVGRSRDGKEALNVIRAEKPDLVTLDVEMPVMDGLTTLREIRRLAATEEVFRRVKVVLVSALTKSGTDTTIQGLNEGAMECLPKPAEGDVDKNQETLRADLLRVVEIVRAQVEPTHVAAPSAPTPVAAKPAVFAPRERRASKSKPESIVIGVSTGGPAALNQMLPELCKVTHLPILIVQHMPPGFTKSLAESLSKKCSFTVKEAENEEVIRPLHVYIAPGGRHMEVVSHGVERRISIHDAPAENGCRPAVDVLFRSAAQVYGGATIPIILTGMGSDGTRGAQPLHGAGASIIVQDKASSVVWGMPGSVVESGIADQVLPLMQIPEAVSRAL